MTKAVHLLFLWGTALSACTYDVRFEDCTVRCATDSECPEGLTCGEEGLCHSPNEVVTCQLPNDGMGGTITHVDGRTIHSFTAVGSTNFIAPAAAQTFEVLIVGGGGGGGSSRGGGGGGGGGVVHISSYANSQSSYSVVVGDGGLPAHAGENSTFGNSTAIGGGGGRPSAMVNGGCGGGASHDTNDGLGGKGTVDQGMDGGGTGYNSGSEVFAGAGGGGSLGYGAGGYMSGEGNGGSGKDFSISGESVVYAGGGGGGVQDLGNHNLKTGMGGMGGGGAGGLNDRGKDGVPSTGGGGGGGGAFMLGGHGSSGIVIVSYQTSL